jgi:NAD+ kinase
MKIILFSRPQPLRSTEELQKLVDAIDRHGFDYAVNEEFAQMIEQVLYRHIPAENRYGETIGKQPANCVMVCYGGDGTLLEGIHRLDGAAMPVVGINSGHLGFLAIAPKESIDIIFNDIRNNNLKIEQRTMLALEGLTDGKIHYALNEVAIQRLDATMINIKAHIDNQMTASYFGNGVILSTPTGSTAYSLSAGGPIVTPTCNCLILSPLTPHNLTMRPMVIPDASTVRFEIDTRNRPASVSLDNRTFEIVNNTTLTVRRAERVVFLAVPHNISFYDTLRNKMMWGMDIR